MQVAVDVADKIIKKFFSIVPGVAKFLTSLGDAGKARGYIKTSPPFSRVRWFPKWEYIDFKNLTKDDQILLGEIERACKNHPFQGSNADCTKQALIYTQKEIDDNNYPVEILMTIHDEIVSLSKEEFAETWKPILEDCMIRAAQLVIKTIPVVVDCKISDQWEK